jgi:hypothetical protein
MYIEDNGNPFTSELQLDTTGRRNDVLETIEYARANLDDAWGAPRINHLIGEGRDLEARISDATIPEFTQDVVHEMLSAGSYNGTVFDLPLTQRKAGGWNHKWPNSGSLIGQAETLVKRRLVMSRLYVMNPNLASQIIEIALIGVHGSGGIGIPDIINNGLLSHQEMYDRGRMPLSGEQLNPRGRATFVSFVEWDEFDTAINYGRNFGTATTTRLKEDIGKLDRDYSWMNRKATDHEHLIKKINSGELSEWENQLLAEPFFAVWGLSKNVLLRRQRVGVDSDIKSEFGFLGWGIPSSELPIVFVPTESTGVVKELAEESLSASELIVADELEMRLAVNTLGFSNEWVVRHGSRQLQI